MGFCLRGWDRANGFHKQTLRPCFSLLIPSQWWTCGRLGTLNSAHFKTPYRRWKTVVTFVFRKDYTWSILVSLSTTQRPTAHNCMNAFRPVVLRGSRLSFCPPHQGSSHSRAGGTCKDGYCVNAWHPLSAGILLCGSRGKQCTVIPLPKVITTQSETSSRFNTREFPELVNYSQLFAIEIKRTTSTSRLYWMTGFKKMFLSGGKQRTKRKDIKSFLLTRVRGDHLGGVFPGSQ